MILRYFLKNIKKHHNTRRRKKHDTELVDFIESNECDDDEIDDDSKETLSIGSDSTTESMREFKNIEKILEETDMDNSIHDKNESVLAKRKPSYHEDLKTDRGIFDNTISKDVIRTIEYNNRDLSLTFKEFIFYSKITSIAKLIDSICLILFPFVFFIIIIIIFSYKF